MQGNSGAYVRWTAFTLTVFNGRRGLRPLQLGMCDLHPPGEDELGQGGEGRAGVAGLEGVELVYRAFDV